MPKRIAHLGPPGTFSEEAAILHDPLALRMPLPSVPAAAAAVEAGQADEAVAAIENSIEGPVTDTLDLLIHESRLKIRKELVLPITQCLIVKPGTKPEQVIVIYSHTNALGQCRLYLERMLPKAKPVAALSTVKAVEQVMESTTPAAAIGPGRSAELYGAQVLERGIEDNHANATRFVVLAFEDHPPTGDDKTSIAFSFLEDKPGQLYGVLGEFAVKGINLAKVESRPSKESLGKYWFLVDLQGHRLDPSVAETLDRVRRRTSMVKVFGSYPRWKG